MLLSKNMSLISKVTVPVYVCDHMRLKYIAPPSSLQSTNQVDGTQSANASMQIYAVCRVLQIVGIDHIMPMACARPDSLTYASVKITYLALFCLKVEFAKLMEKIPEPSLS